MTPDALQKVAALSVAAGLGRPLVSFSGATGKRTWRTSEGHWLYWFDTVDKAERAIVFSNILAECGVRSHSLQPLDGLAGLAWSAHVDGHRWTDSEPEHLVVELMAALARVNAHSTFEDRGHPGRLLQRLRGIDQHSVELCGQALPWTLSQAAEVVESCGAELSEVCWCHRDLSRGNLLVDTTQAPGRRVGWIDFEHARRDCPIVEWGRIWREFDDQCAPMWISWNAARTTHGRPPMTSVALLLALHLEYWQTVRWLRRRNDESGVTLVVRELAGFPARWAAFLERVRALG